jgi:hypothetical protein
MFSLDLVRFEPQYEATLANRVRLLSQRFELNIYSKHFYLNLGHRYTR